VRFFYWLSFYVARARYEWARGAMAGYGRPSIGKEEQIVAILKTGQYVSAIKTHRDLFGSSMKDAKDAIDALKVKHDIQ
jgi:ribosomal protein L7/L12